MGHILKGTCLTLFLNYMMGTNKKFLVNYFYNYWMIDSRPFMKQVHKLNVCLISTNKHNMDVDES